MNIAFFVTTFPNLSETFIVNQIIALQNSGHTVHIFSQHKPPQEKIHQSVLDAGLLNNTFYLVNLGLSRQEKIRKLLYKLFANFSIKNIVKVCRTAFWNTDILSVYELVHFLDKPEYDVLHAHFGPNGNYATKLLKIGLYPKAKFVTTFHGYDLDQKLKKNHFYASLFSSCNAFTVNSGYSKNLLVKLGCEENKITILPVGLHIENFRKSRREYNRDLVKLLFVGRLIKLKGPLLFLQICKRLREKDIFKFNAVVIGEGEMGGELSAFIQLENLGDIVTLVGAKTQKEVVQYMNNSDIFILPGIEANGLSEAQGLVIQEAQAMQLPVIISDTGGMAEGMQDGITGFVLPQNDLSCFAEKIELLALNPSLRERMGSVGRKFVSEHYNSVSLNKKLLEIYKS